MLELFDNPDWSIQTQRVIAEGAYGGADVFEVARTAQTIASGDTEAWYAGWLKLAEETEAAGQEALSAGAKVTARQRLFRASNYYRHADFLHARDRPAQTRKLSARLSMLQGCDRSAIACHRGRFRLRAVQTFTTDISVTRKIRRRDPAQLF